MDLLDIAEMRILANDAIEAALCNDPEKIDESGSAPPLTALDIMKGPAGYIIRMITHMMISTANSGFA